VVAPSVAPTARRTPISRVRSDSDASITFMIPIPPTSSDAEAMLTSSVENVSLAAICALTTSSG
jgi:hypothetical protein